MTTTPMQLFAGPVVVDLDNGDLRCIRVGNTEIIRRVYMVFQDRNWTSRPWLLSAVEVDQASDGFAVRFTAQGTFDARAFTWACAIEGAFDGSITYSVTGDTTEPFLRNRLGLCVLHPMALAGAHVRIEHTSGDTEEARFPDAISPHQPFLDIRAMTHEITPGFNVRLELSGEIFETEDHRNWSDASYKTYCTPIALPFPVTVVPSWRLEQSARITFTGIPPATQSPDRPVEIEVFDAVAPLPRIGLQANDKQLTDAHLAALRMLALDHLRISIDASVNAKEMERHLRDAAFQAASLDCSLHVALFDADAEALDLLARIDNELGGIVARWFIFQSDELVTSRHWTDLARTAFGAAACIGGGTNLYFTELNRQPPDTSDLDVVGFSMNPQVHSFDDRTIIQNSATAMVIARDAPRLAGTSWISVAPITLRPRFNPNETNLTSDLSNDQLPASDDYRQPTWFAAVWAALSIGSIAGPGTIDSVTYFETIGPRGVLDALSAKPYPVHALFAALAGYHLIRLCTSSNPETCDALILVNESGSRLIVINTSALEHVVHLHGFLDERITAAPRGLTIIDRPEGSHDHSAL